MPKHPSGPHTPSPLPSPRAPKPWGTWSPQTAKEALPSGIPVAPATSPLCFLRGACQGDHWPFNTRFGGKSGGAKTEQKHRIRETRHPPATWLGGRDCPAPCVTALLKDYLVLVFVCHGRQFLQLSPRGASLEPRFLRQRRRQQERAEASVRRAPWRAADARAEAALPPRFPGSSDRRSRSAPRRSGRLLRD